MAWMYPSKPYLPARQPHRAWPVSRARRGGARPVDRWPETQVYTRTRGGKWEEAADELNVADDADEA